ncbi:MAG: hypothetical protein WCV73_00750 [Patescibacteria group bacterium]|jgi:hypothetical protein
MKIYFFSKESNQANAKKIQQDILTFFKNNGLVVLSNLLSVNAAEEHLSFEKMDGLVIEGATSESEAGYLIALALAQSKPILYLMPKGTLLPDQLKSLQENSKLKKLFLLHYYSERTLSKYLVDFIDIIETGELRREVPTVKFTLRFTPRADRYLTWLNRSKKYKKADYLRKLIDEKIQADEEYQAQLRQSDELDK